MNAPLRTGRIILFLPQVFIPKFECGTFVEGVKVPVIQVSAGLYDGGLNSYAAVRLTPTTQFLASLCDSSNAETAASGHFRDFKVKKVRGCETMSPLYLTISIVRRPWVKI